MRSEKLKAAIAKLDQLKATLKRENVDVDKLIAEAQGKNVGITYEGLERVVAKWMKPGITIRKVQWNWIDSKARIFLQGPDMEKSPKTAWVAWDKNGYFYNYGLATLTGPLSDIK